MWPQSAGQEVLDFDSAEVLFVSVLLIQRSNCCTCTPPARAKICASHSKDILAARFCWSS